MVELICIGIGIAAAWVMVALMEPDHEACRPAKEVRDE